MFDWLRIHLAVDRLKFRGGFPRSHAAVMAEAGQGSNAAKEEPGSGGGIGRGKGHGESHAKERGGDGHAKERGEGHAK